MSNTQKSIQIANASQEFNTFRRKIESSNKHTKHHKTKLRKFLAEVCLKYDVRFEFMERLLLNRN